MQIIQDKELTNSSREKQNNMIKSTYVSLTSLAVIVIFFYQTATIYFFYNKFFILEQSQQTLQLGIEEIFRKELRQSLYNSDWNDLSKKHSQTTYTEYNTIKSAYRETSKPLRKRRNVIKREISSEDELSVQLQAQPNEDGTDESWLQLTSYAKIPHDAIQEFCSRTRDSCPAGPKGNIGFTGEIGFPGKKGIQGTRGLPGVQGPRGLRGPVGMMGANGNIGRIGSKGVSGENGIDGRDGLPGEPGLDGIPGRNGLDGMPGIDGAPGFGEKGSSGENGFHGVPGTKGTTGKKGESGPTGLTGPRGRSGKDGIPGMAGLPGINTWTVNETVINELLIPPRITGIAVEDYQRRNPILLPPNSILDPIKMYYSIHDGSRRHKKIMIVRENDNVRLHCKAAGHPRPIIEWSREDGRAIATGQWKDGSVVGDTLNLTHIRRDHTGTYRCDASNAIPPDAHKTFKIEVYFDPYIRINQWKVAAENATDTLLECYIEAFPIAVLYWEDHRRRILEGSVKNQVKIFQDKNFIWKSKMTLLLKNVTNEDYGNYHCVAKNDLSTTRGLIEVYRRDPNKQIPATGKVDGKIFGPQPPRYSELFDDLCPPPVICPTCPEHKMELGSSSLFCLRVQQFGNYTYPGYNNRSTDCLLSAVGKAVFHRYTKSTFGSWLRDPLPRGIKIGYFWATLPTDTRHLYEYNGKQSFRNGTHTRSYTLPVPFSGNSHVIYNGSFFYHESGKSKIVRYDLGTGTAISVKVPLLNSKGSNYLYSRSRDYIDFNTDDNGLWAIYGEPESNNTIVAKIDPWVMKIEYSWNISISHHKFGEMFIVCGVLYGIDSSTEKNTKIRFALDLYKKTLLDVDLPFHNPFSQTAMLGYNHRKMEIFSWDNGNQLTYPIKVISIGYGESNKETSATNI